MFISALILFFLVLIAYSLIESFNRPIIEGAKGKMGKKKGNKKKGNKKAAGVKSDEIDENGEADGEDAVETDVPATGAPAQVPAKAATKSSAKAVPAPSTSPTIDVTPRLNEFDARIKELNTRVTNVETQVQTIQTGLAGSQQTTVDVGEEDDSENV